MENAIAVNKKCHDCGKGIDIEGKEIKNGLRLNYKEGEETIEVFKCKDCFESNPSLNNFRKCEVYSRIVGYIRPIRQWHVGKKQEFKEREEFKVPAKVV